jgi:hypothetical protein
MIALQTMCVGFSTHPCLNCGALFSKNAAIPSFWSAVANSE